jgi:hypothetical protein
MCKERANEGAAGTKLLDNILKPVRTSSGTSFLADMLFFGTFLLSVMIGSGREERERERE